MPYPTKHLHEGEDVVLDIHPHWWSLAAPVLALAVAVAVAVAVGVNLDHDAATVATVVLMVAAALWVVVRWLTWVTTSFVLTTDRVVYRYGVLRRHTREIPIERVNEVETTQSLLQRMVQAGDLTVETGGETDNDTYRWLPKPVTIQHVIQRELDRSARRAGAGAPTGTGGASIPEQLDKLDELRQRGVLTQAEFDAKKADLLDRL